MNPILPTNNTGTERFINPTSNPGVRPFGLKPYNDSQVRPVRTEGPQSDGRNDNNYQQIYMQQNHQHLQNPYQHQPQNITQQNQRQFNMQQQQPIIRGLPNEASLRPQVSQGYNQKPNGIHSSSGAPFEGQRSQMAPQVRPVGPQQLVRPLSNPNGEIPVNQPNLQNYQRIEAPKTPSDRIQTNPQNSSENYKTQLPRGTSQSSKPSEVDVKLPSNANNNQKLAEASGKSHVTGYVGGAPKTDWNEKKPDVQEARTNDLGAIASDPGELSAETNENKLTKFENNEKETTADTKTKEKSQKKNKKHSNKDESITSGMVQKNIKFFEENDTAKTPLRPEATPVRKSKKITEVPKDVIKSDTHEDEYESGVDETPVVHPNLGSIFQVPRKVAKIPYLKTRNRSRKMKTKRPHEEPINKKQIYRRPLAEFIKPGRSYLSYKPGSKKAEKIKTYGSKEELLAFFENTKSWRKLKRYDESKTDQNAGGDKIVHKPTTNGDIPTPKKTPSRLQTPSKKNPPVSPTKTPLKSPGTPGTPGPKSLPKTPESPAPPTPLIKKVPMNKIQVGAAPSPNLKTVKSKVGSLANTTHKPGGGNVKIESHKIDLSKVQPRTEAKNDMYKPSGGEKKIQQMKLQWSAKSKIGSLENATYKPGGGDKKIESVKLDFKEKAKPKVGSKDNVKHVPGGGNVKIDNQKLEFKAQSKIGSLDNVKHKPGGGDIKIFDDKTYLRQVSGNSSEGRASGTHAYSDLSVVREVEGRSAPGTPGRKTSIKIKKTTTIENSSESPKIKNITKVTVTSQIPKKEKNTEKSLTKQQVKVSSTKNGVDELCVGIVRLPANDDAPILKQSLSKKDLIGDPVIGKQTNENENATDLNETVSNKNVRIAGSMKENPVSPSLPKGNSNRDDSGMSKFLHDEIATQEKIGEIWRERNSVDCKPNPPNVRRQDGQQKELPQTYLPENSECGNNHRQLRPQNPGTIADIHIAPNESHRLNFHSNINMQYDHVSQNSTFQSQQQRQMNQESSLFPP